MPYLYCVSSLDVMEDEFYHHRQIFQFYRRYNGHGRLLHLRGEQCWITALRLWFTDTRIKSVGRDCLRFLLWPSAQSRNIANTRSG